jgi:hypothetical protein
MQHTAAVVGLALSLALPPCLAGQDQQVPPPYSGSSSQHVQTGSIARDHGEVGVYGDYFRFSPTSPRVNFVGVGARAALNVRPSFALEAEMNYDFARNFTTTYDNGGTTLFAITKVRPLTGLFGPTILIGANAPLRAFVTGKVGFIDFSTNTSGVVSGSTFTGAVAGVGGSGTHLALYPGAGLEGFIGWFGMRFEAGDEVYLNKGTYNDLRANVGPVIRF